MGSANLGAQPAQPGTHSGRVVHPGQTGRGSRLYALAVLAAGAISLAWQPIVALDHDIFYHLSHGRHILAGHGIPHTAYFSFLTPQRTWVDYYWLFQVLVAGLHGLGGFLALIALRVALFTLCMLAVYATVFRRRDGEAPVMPAWGGALVALTAVALVGRFHLIRPHTTSYTLIAIFLCVIEARPRWLVALPVLALAWVNLHGIEFPVMVAITLSYLGAYFLRRLLGASPEPPFDRQPQPALIALSLATLAVIATPAGSRLFRVPFIDTHFASSYIAELAPVRWGELLHLDLAPLSLDAATASALLVILAGLAVLAALAGLRRRAPSERTANLAPWGLAAAGFLLLARSDRFRPEMLLLALPMLRDAWPAGSGPRPHPRFVKLLCAVAAALPLLYMAQNVRRFKHDPWPFSNRGLPAGSAAFLRQETPGGRLLNHPNQGGYWQWALGSQYRILSDMEVPFLFSDADHYRATAAFQDPEMLRALLRENVPDMIASPVEHAAFPALLATVAPRFRPVFFDDRVVLFADRDRHPRLVARWGLAVDDPLALRARDLEAMPAALRAQLAAQLERMLDIAPVMDIPRRALALIRLFEGRLEAAREQAEQAVLAAPWAWQPWSILSTIELRSSHPARAAEAGEQALARLGGAPAAAIERALADAYQALGRPRDAYRALERAVGRFNRAASCRDLAHLGSLALAAGALDEARLLLDMARQECPPEAATLRQQLDRALARLSPLPVSAEPPAPAAPHG